MASPAVIRTPRVNQVSGAVVDAALRVHSQLGPGLLESACQACLAHELRKRGFHVATQVGLPVVYEGEKLELGYRIDVLVENLVVVEIKCMDGIHPVHEAQLFVLSPPLREERWPADQLPRPSLEGGHQAYGGWKGLGEVVLYHRGHRGHRGQPLRLERGTRFDV
jgi:GxxExxY protein